MKNNNSSKIIIPINDLRSSLCSTFIPALINVIAMFVIIRKNKYSDSYYSLIWPLVSSIITLFAILILHNLLPRYKLFRPFSKYEGRWLQIIPDFKRTVSIIDFEYNKKNYQYEMKGFNFTSDKKSGIGFSAHKFIERDYHDGFYYITNHTIEQRNGLGKIGFLETNYDGLIRAEGYFFDSDGKDECSKKYNTIMIKCDENFSKVLFPEYGKNINIEKIPPSTIVEKSSDFIEKEITSYKEQIVSNEMQKSCRCPYNNIQNDTSNVT